MPCAPLLQRMAPFSSLSLGIGLPSFLLYNTYVIPFLPPKYTSYHPLFTIVTHCYYSRHHVSWPTIFASYHVLLNCMCPSATCNYHFKPQILMYIPVC